MFISIQVKAVREMIETTLKRGQNLPWKPLVLDQNVLEIC
jgi:hypothetical protein